MDSDETKFLPNTRKTTENEPFDFGDRTIFQLRNQDFQPDEEFGTVVSRLPLPESEPASAEHAQAAPPASGAEPAPQEAGSTAEPAPIETAPEDPIARLEQKVDLALRQLHHLQQRLESLDATIARALLR